VLGINGHTIGARTFARPQHIAIERFHATGPPLVNRAAQMRVSSSTGKPATSAIRSSSVEPRGNDA
jgi:hypothetical protein